MCSGALIIRSVIVLQSFIALKLWKYLGMLKFRAFFEQKSYNVLQIANCELMFHWKYAK